MSGLLTASQVAILLNVRSVKVWRLIDAHELQAVNITPKGKRKTWRIAPEALNDFKRQQQHTPEEVVRRRQAKSARRVIQFT